MSIRTSLNLLQAAWRIGGIRGALLLQRYGKLWWLHRRLAPVIRVLPTAAPQARTRGEPPAADLVIPVYNAFEDTEALLASLRADAAAYNSIVLVNDCSPDPRVAPLLKSFEEAVSNAVLLENPENRGFVRTCNRGMETATRDVVILNTDIELPSGAIARMLRRLHEADDIATVTPFSNNAYGVGVPDLIRSNGRPFGAKTDEIDAAFQSLGGLASIDIPRGVGFCMAISRSALDRVGAFSEVFGTGYGEEADFCLRARQAGYRSLVAPDAYVFHKEGQSFGASSQEKARTGGLLFLDRHPEYPAMMRAYLKRGEAKAAVFQALVALMKQRSGQAVQIRQEQADESNRETPQIVLSERAEGACVRLIWAGESYAFVFAETALRLEAFRRAGLETEPRLAATDKATRS